MARLRTVIVSILTLLAQPAAAQPVPAQPDWAKTLATDARAYHAEQMVNHPGPQNRRDPDFSRRLDAALAQALMRAKTVSTPGGYMFAMREMVASFNDGHMYIGFNDKLDVPGQWPGFVATYADGVFVVRDAAPGIDMPAVGHRIIQCDGRDPTVLIPRSE